MTTASTHDADAIQRQMQTVRSSLREDVKELVENARDMTDWQYYVKRYPWGTLALAAGAGFLVTPALLRTKHSVTAPTYSHPVPVPVPAPAEARAQKAERSALIGRLISSAFNAATSAVSRAALGVATQQLSAFLAGEMAPRNRGAKDGDEQHVEPHF
jgi:hypothetical protein